ncbi:MAG: phage virion morphogenesis protein [Alphaproteobacteria bacterium]|nr:phage virion morphogenesis protein [Alphaproteobacteria bacterium]
MTDTAASLKFEGDKKTVAALNYLADPRERLGLLEAIGAYGVSSTQQRFLSQVAPDGTPWKPLLRAKEGNGMTLRMTSRLFQSFNFNASQKAVEWGTNVVYAGIHQFGGTIVPKLKKALAFHLANGAFVMVKKVEVPARPFLGINEYDRGRIYGIAKKWTAGATA